MTNIEALKQLAAKVCKVDVSEVTGSTIAEVITFMAEHYPAAEK